MWFFGIFWIRDFKVQKNPQKNPRKGRKPQNPEIDPTKVEKFPNDKDGKIGVSRAGLKIKLKIKF